MSVWLAVAGTCLGCYLLKLGGLSAPRSVLEHPVVRRFADLVPVALLAALVTVQTVSGDSMLAIDTARMAGIGAALVLLLVRAPFLVVLLAAAAVTAGMRLLGLG